MKIIRYYKLFQFLNPLTFYSWVMVEKCKRYEGGRKGRRAYLQHKSVQDLLIIGFEMSTPIMSKFIMNNTLESQLIKYIPN